MLGNLKFAAEADLAGEGVSGRVEGALIDLKAKSSRGLQLSLKADSLKPLGALVGKEWPDSGTLSGEAVLVKADNAWSLDDISVQSVDGIEVQAVGSVSLLKPMNGQFDVNASLSADQIATHAKRYNIRLPKLDGVTGTGTVQFNRADNSLLAKDINFTALTGKSWLKGKGAISDLRTLTLDDMQLNAEVASFAVLNQVHEINLPEFGSINATRTPRG